MIQLTAQTRIFLALSFVDFRKGIDGLASLCRQMLQEDPFSGAVFLFRNRQRNSIKLLLYDGQGFWLCNKRLSKGKFKWWPRLGEPDRKVIIHAHELQTLLWNGHPKKASFAKEWRKIS
jgi:transposase